MSVVYGPKWPLRLYCTVWDRYMQVLYLGRAPRTKETLPDFLKWRRVTRHPLVFRGLTGSQRTPGFGASQFSNSLDKIFETVFRQSRIVLRFGFDPRLMSSSFVVCFGITIIR